MLATVPRPHVTMPLASSHDLTWASAPCANFKTEPPGTRHGPAHLDMYVRDARRKWIHVMESMRAFCRRVAAVACLPHVCGAMSGNICVGFGLATVVFAVA